MDVIQTYFDTYMPELNPFESPSASAVESGEQTKFQVPILACLVALASNLGAALPILALFRFPYGSSGRPFDELSLSFAFVLFGLLIGIPVVVKSYRKSPDIRVRSVCIVLFFLCLSPVPLAAFVTGLVENLHGFEFLD